MSLVPLMSGGRVVRPTLSMPESRPGRNPWSTPCCRFCHLFRPFVEPPLADIDPVRSTTSWISSGTELHGEHAFALVEMSIVFIPSTLQEICGHRRGLGDATVLALLHGRFEFDPTQLVATVTVTPARERL